MAPHQVELSSGSSAPLTCSEGDASPFATPEQALMASPGDDGPMPIAIVGMSCRFPGDATNPSKLWDMLCDRRSAWSPIPKDKFNGEAFFHPDPDRNGAINVEGGHFLKEDTSRFDASFFSISPNEAKAIDPQQRLQLESAYEALENAGIPMEKVAGSNTSVYVGVFSKDYSEMLGRDPETIPAYTATGNGFSILSNRISYFFDLKGPSMTLDTACSASLSALHLACQSLRTGESEMAIVGGTNVIHSPDLMICMSLLRFLSQPGKCFSFDHRACGYSRGEGVGTVVLKPLDAALRDGDPIRAVIRSSAVNQDGRTQGITLPSRQAQEALIRKAYEGAGLDPSTTGYFEAHGTGTAVGDPLEAGAIATVLGPGRSAENPIVVGSIKTNVGHLEGASGIAGVIKAALIVEHGLIPPNLNFEKPNGKIPLDEWKIKIPLECHPWPKAGLRRASVNSFGYGGSNAHVILDDAEHFLKQYKNGTLSGTARLLTNGLSDGTVNAHTHGYTKGISNGDGDGHTNGISNGTNGHHTATKLLADGPLPNPSDGELVFLLSANDGTSGKAWADRLAEYIESHTSLPGADEHDLLTKLAYTLSERRSKLPMRCALRASSAKELVAALSSTSASSFQRVLTRPPKVGFVFTGQGAQWVGMSKELIAAYPLFEDRIAKAERLFQKLGASWSLSDELFGHSSSDTESPGIDSPRLSQPLCTAIQLALVDLLASWGVTPSCVTGHSSGEIAAAYAAGALSFETALKVAYFRGVHAADIQTDVGGMLAVGLSQTEAQERIERLGHQNKLGVACVNSPSSVTVSGDVAALDELAAAVKADEVFARRLKVKVAYHSHHMQTVAADYERSLQGMEGSVGQSKVPFYSSVTGEQIDHAELIRPRYWVRNMVSPVLFSQSATNMCLAKSASLSGKKTRNRSSAASKPDVLLEVGPHAALSGPIKQILTAATDLPTKPTYTSVLQRGQSGVSTALDAASHLIGRGVPVQLASINFPLSPSIKMTPLVDLPPYAWNHSAIHWSESRLSTAYRFRQFPRHDLVGAPAADFNPVEPRWRNFLRVGENPWVLDHKVAGSPLYPAAGMMIAAIEAMRQMIVINQVSRPVVGFELRDVNIGKALVVPETYEGVETVLELRPLATSARQSSDVWWEFRLYSVGKQQAEGWNEHCRGRIAYRFDTAASVVDGGREAELRQKEIERLLEEKKRLEGQGISIPVDTLYDALDSVGLSYGETFRNVTALWGGEGSAFGTFKVADVAKVMPYNFEYPYLIHPATLDALLHSIFPALAGASPDGSLKIVDKPMVPVFVNRMYVSTEMFGAAPGTEYTLWADGKMQGFRNARADIYAISTAGTGNGTAGRSVIEVEGLQCSSLADAQMNNGSSSDQSRAAVPKLCFTEGWDVDIDLLTPEMTSLLFSPKGPDSADSRVLSAFREVAYYSIRDALASLTEADVAKAERHHQIFYKWMKKMLTPISSDVEGSGGGVAYEHFFPYTASSEADEAARKEEIFGFAESSSVEGQMAVRVGRNLAKMIKGEVNPLSLMLEDELLYAVYQGKIGTERCYETMTAYLDKVAYKNPQLKILEVGSGTGGATRPILEKLGGGRDNYARFAHYDFTDVSKGFFEKGQENFAKWYEMGLLDFKALDIEQDPEAQGFEEGGYDVVVAANVLHATQKMKVTMVHVRKLLKPGGKLVLMELTERQPWMTLVFGNLPGWWLGHEDGRVDGPSLSVEEWDALLKETGFSGIQVSVPDYPDAKDRVYSVMTATAVDPKPRLELPIRTLILPPLGDEVDEVTDLVIRHIESSMGITPIKTTLDSLADTAGCAVISLLEFSRPVLATLTESQFDSLRTAIWNAKGVFWVTRGATIDSAVPEANLITGLSRTLRAENHALKFVTLDLEASLSPQATPNAATITRLFTHTFSDISENQGRDFEFTERNSTIFIPRIFEDSPTNEFIAKDSLPAALVQPELERFSQPDRPLKLDIGTPGLLDTLRFVDDPTFSQSPGPDEVDIDVRATGVNFKDVMVSMGQLVENFLGCEVSGVVSRVGPGITHVAPGDRVCAWTLGGYGTHLRNAAGFVAKIPQDMSFEVAASLPIVYCTAYYSLFDVGRLTAGESVLIHAAAGGVGQAAIKLAQHAGARVFVTVGTEEKRKLLMESFGIPEEHIFSSRDISFAAGIKRMTHGQGVDVVLNSLAGESLAASWDCIAPFGRFVEIGKRDIELDSKLAMSNFARNTSFASVDLTIIIRQNKKLGARILKDVMDLVHKGVVQGVQPLTVFTTPHIEQAFRLMQAGKHIGKLVVVNDPDAMVNVIPRATRPLSLSPDGSYLMVGGLGGLGRSTSLWMADHGARNMIFLSRSGTDKPAAQECVRELEAKGVNVAVYRCDVSDDASLSSAVTRWRAEMPPVKGVIHGGMVLRDGIFENMTHSDWQGALSPKVAGTLNLCRAFSSPEHSSQLDFFLLLSSSVGTVGNFGQGNYSAGSTFQDAVAHSYAFRQSSSPGSPILPIVTLDLGMILGAGYVAENEHAEQNLSKWGFLGIAQEKYLSIIKSAILNPRRPAPVRSVSDHLSTSSHPGPLKLECQVATGLGTRGMVDSAIHSSPSEADYQVPFWFYDTRFSHLLQIDRLASRSSNSSANDAVGGTAAQLAAALKHVESFGAAQTVLCDCLLDKMSKVLMIPLAELNSALPMSAYGVDSLVAVEIRNWIFREMKVDMPVFELQGGATLMELCETIGRRTPLLRNEVKGGE